jgi:hypothetical protein
MNARIIRFFFVVGVGGIFAWMILNFFFPSTEYMQAESFKCYEERRLALHLPIQTTVEQDTDIVIWCQNRAKAK